MNDWTLGDCQRIQVQQWLGGGRTPAVLDVLNGLSYNPRRIIRLRYGLTNGHCYDVEETAMICSKPVSWVLMLEAFALFQLYQFLQDAGRLSVSPV